VRAQSFYWIAADTTQLLLHVGDHAMGQPAGNENSTPKFVPAPIHRRERRIQEPMDHPFAVGGSWLLLFLQLRAVLPADVHDKSALHP
jgi:hypothetical protein